MSVFMGKLFPNRHCNIFPFKMNEVSKIELILVSTKYSIWFKSVLTRIKCSRMYVFELATYS